MSQSLKKIAFVSYDFPEYSIRHANEMANHAQVLLLLPQHIAREYLSLLDPRVRFEPFQKPRLRQPLRQVVTALTVLRRLHRFAPDVVHLQNGHMYFNLVLPLIKKFPLVITVHDAQQHLGDRESGHTPQRIMDFGFRRADRVIVHGRSLVDTLVAKFAFDRAHVHVLPHIALGNTHATLPICDEEQSILFFGRIWQYKGLEYLVRAMPQVNAQFPAAKCIIAGRGEDFDLYRQWMDNPAAFVIHNDWISDQQRDQLFSSCSMVVLPYIEASQSGVIPIAYAFEKPVIATRIGGLPDMIEHGQTGLLVAPGEVHALAEAICQLLRDRSGRIAMGRAGKRKLDEQCAPSVVVPQTLEVYRQAIADRCPAAGA